LSELIEVGLAKNGWFEQVVIQPLVPGGASVAFIVFSKAVVQFFNDDLSDLYHNYNNVVAFSFKDVLNPAPGALAFTVQPQKVNCKSD